MSTPAAPYAQHAASDMTADQMAARIAELEAQNGAGGARAPSPLDQLRTDLKLPTLATVHKYGRDGQRYVGYLADGTAIKFGTADDLYRGSKWKGTLLPHTGETVKHAQEEWDRIATRIEQASELQDVALEEREQTCGWLAGFQYAPEFRRKDEYNRDDNEDMLTVLDRSGSKGAVSFRGTDGRMYVRLPNLCRHVQVDQMSRTSQADLANRLGALGFTRHQLAVRDGEKIVKARYWRSPPGFDPEED